MTDIIEMAKQSGLTAPDLGDRVIDYGYAKDEIRKFAALIAEECAEIVDDLRHEDANRCCNIALEDAADAIRAKFDIRKGE